MCGIWAFEKRGGGRSSMSVRPASALMLKRRMSSSEGGVSVRA